MGDVRTQGGSAIDARPRQIDFERMPRLGDIPAYYAQLHPDAPAMRFGGHATNWAQLDARVSAVAAALLASGVAPGERVAFIGKGSDRFFELMFGAARAGIVLVPLQWRLAVPEAQAILRHSEARLLFVEEDQFAVIDQYAASLTGGGCIALSPGSAYPEWEAWLAGAAGKNPGLPEVEATQAAIQLYTSGTTGEPKGVMLSHANILAGRRDSMRANMRWNEWQEGDVNLVALPLGHIGGVGWAIVGFYNGATTLIHAEFVPDAFIDALAEEGVSKTFLVPTAIQILLTRPGIREREFPRLRTMLYGASPIALDLLREATEVFACEFVQQYGMTETCGTIVYLPPEDHDPAGNERMRSAGLPMPGVELRVVEPIARTPLAVREVGEVETRSVANMIGYWNAPDKTGEVVDGEGWLRTGDAGYLDAQGYLYICDRFKDMICSGAENVYPAEVENAIYGHPAVAEVAVIGVPDERWGEAVKAVVVLRPGSVPCEAEILAFARSRIGGHKVPKSIDFVEALPRTPSGKVMRRLLRDPYWQGRERAVN
ncbi:long-chain-fatty-acid--CoA ligase [Novosphingobium profundi]|uniref:long-chain-fatty-acid--CoA ligase n=1 Tax=Novosphingobium profundi TaxID=1774954 RepID=UPI001FEA4AF9|nr:long-chain-fatty-acid--CoA ligase [Novosphingobium profundi]MBT0669527.1 long-chain-fatty-acid--CoA ligase [Novosphingobium profundi]